MAPARTGGERRELARRQRAQGSRPDADRQPAGHRARLRRRHVLPVAAGEVRPGEVPLRDARPPRRGVAQRSGRRRRSAPNSSGSHRSRHPRRARAWPSSSTGTPGGALRPPESLPSQRLDWLAQARAWNAALFALGHPVDTVRADRSVRRLRRRRRAEPLRHGCRAGRRAHRVRRPWRPTRGRPVLGRRRRHRDRCTTAARPGRSAICSGSRSTSTGRSPTGARQRVDSSPGGRVRPSRLERVARAARGHRGARSSPHGRARRAGRGDPTRARAAGEPPGISAPCSSSTG